MNATKYLTYGLCCRCDADYVVKKDGTLRSHTNRDSRETGLPQSSHCEGSGSAPRRSYVWPVS